MRAPGARLQVAVTLIAIDPVVTDATTDPIGSGELGHGVEPGEIFGDELHTLVHRGHR
jgi:hypothetical protein